MADNIEARYADADSNTLGPLRFKDIGGVLYAVSILAQSDGTLLDTLPVSAASLPLPSGASTAANQSTANGLLTTIDGDTGTIATHAATLAGAVSGTEMQVDIVSGSVTVTGVSTLAEQQSQTTLLGTIDTDTGAIATSAASIDTKTPALGQALAAASVPVVLTAAQLSTLTPPAAITGFALESGGNLAAIATDAAAIEVLLGTIDGDTGTIATHAATLAGAVSGTEVQVDVLTMPTVAVTGTFWQATQPVSGTVTADLGAVDNAVLDAIAASLAGTLTVGSHAVTNAGTFAVQAAQSGTWNITNVSGTVSLPTGASTAAKQPALGTAGTASSDVITVQGIASMTALKVDGSAVTQPVSGTFWQATQPISGTVTADLGATDNAVLDAIAASLAGTLTVGSHAVTNAGTFATQATLQAGTAYAGKVRITDGTNDSTLLNLTNSKPIPTAIVDGDGTQITSFGGGTQYTEGDTDASITGTAMLWEDAANTLATVSAGSPLPVAIIAGGGSGGTSAADDADFTAGTTAGTPAMGVYESSPTSVTDGDLGTVGITATRALRTAIEGTVVVDLGANNDVTVTGSVTANAGTNLNTSALAVESGGNLAAIATDAAAIEVLLTGIDADTDAIKTAVQLIDDAIVTDGGAAGKYIALAAFDEADTGFMQRLNMDNATGALLVNIAGSSNTIGVQGTFTHDAATNFGTSTIFAVGGRASAAAPTDVSADNDAVVSWFLRNGSQVVNLAVGGTLVTGSAGLPVAQQGTWTVDLGATDNAVLDAIAASLVTVDSNTDSGAVVGNGAAATAQRVTIANDSTGIVGLAAGTNAIGKLTSNTGVTIGAVEIAAAQTLATVSTLTNITNWGNIVDDAAFTPGTTRVLMAGFEADEASTDSVDEGDGGAARMTLDRKIITTPQPHTQGGLSIFRSLDLDETEEEVKASAGQIYGGFITNTSTGTRWIKFYNATAASVTVGSTTPVITWGIQGGATDDVAAILNTGGMGIAFDTAISVAATTGFADADTGAPGANDVIINLFYK